MESCLYCLHPLLLLDGFKEYKSLLAEVKLLEADGIKVRWTLVSSQPTCKAACKWTIPPSDARLMFSSIKLPQMVCNIHHQDFVHSHSRCQQRMRSLEHLWTGPLSLPSDEKGQFNGQLCITRRPTFTSQLWITATHLIYDDALSVPPHNGLSGAGCNLHPWRRLTVQLGLLLVFL